MKGGYWELDEGWGSQICISLMFTQYYLAKTVASLDWLWNGAIRRWVMVEEDLPSMKLGAMDFGLFDATQLLGAW